MDNRIKNKTGTLGSMFWQFPANAEPLILNKTLCHFRFDAGFGLRLVATVALLGAYLRQIFTNGKKAIPICLTT